MFSTNDCLSGTRYQGERDNLAKQVGVCERYLDQLHDRLVDTASMRVAFRHRLFNKQGAVKRQVASNAPRVRSNSATCSDEPRTNELI